MSASKKTALLVGVLASVAIVAACGGGGGGTTLPPGGGGGPTPSPSPSVAPSPSPGLAGTLNFVTGGSNTSNVTYGPAGAAQVVFSCGCNPQAGTATTTGSGGFTLAANSTPTPSAPNPTYTIVPGRNYIVVASAAGSGEAWTMQFAGSNPSRNVPLNSSNTSDVFGAAVSLYVFDNSTGSATAFDDWNFNTLIAWYGVLKTSPNVAETKLLNDIVAQSAAHNTLFPVHPGWNATQPTNSTIHADVASVKSSGDINIPTPCPGGEANCTGTPSP